MANVEKVQKFYYTETSQTLNLSDSPFTRYVVFISGVRYRNSQHKRMFFGCVVLECLMHMSILFDTISAFKSIFPFFFFYPPNLFSFQRRSSESIQLSGRLLYINAECICAKGATGTKLKKMSQQQQYKKNVKGLRQTLRARKLSVCGAFQHLRHHRGRHLTTFLVPLMEPPC